MGPVPGLSLEDWGWLALGALFLGCSTPPWSWSVGGCAQCPCVQLLGMRIGVEASLPHHTVP